MAAPILHKGTLRLGAPWPGPSGSVTSQGPRGRRTSLTQESLWAEEALQPAKACFISKR